MKKFIFFTFLFFVLVLAGCNNKLESYSGVLIIYDNCMIPEGCGPKYILWENETKKYIPLVGKIEDTDSGLIVKINGTKEKMNMKDVMPKEELNLGGDIENKLIDVIKVKNYQKINTIPYHDFLVDKGNEYTQINYPCLYIQESKNIRGTKWDKNFDWEINENETILKIKMIDTSSKREKKPFYEIWYDGSSGNFIKEIRYPENENFCE